MSGDEKSSRGAAGRGWGRLTKLHFLVIKQKVVEDEILTQAAALTYKTLFSLLPVFVLALLILSAISSAGGQNALDATVQKTLFKQLQLDKLPIVDKDGNPTKDAEGKVVTLADTVAPMLKRAKEAVTRPATGLIAFGILLYGSISLMLVIEGAFNRVYEAAAGLGRGWARRILLYWTVLTLGPIGVAVSLVLGRNAFETARGVEWLGWLLPPLNLLMGFGVSWLLVALLYKVVPQTHVAWKSALLGAFAGALLWEAGKTGFGIYVRQAVRGSWYGSLVLLPLFMLWIYMTWIFVLLGLQMSYVHQHWGMLRRRYYFRRKAAVAITDMRWALTLGVLLYRRFEEGKVVRGFEAAEELMMPGDVCEQLLEGLAAAGIVNRVAGHGVMGSRGYALARPPGKITAYELLSAVREMCLLPAELAEEKGKEKESEAMKQWEQMEERWAKGHTLPELAGETV